MVTNKTIKPNTKLAEKANALLLAAYEYWQVYNKELGGSAVVWLEAENGHFVLFTRSEYKESILFNAMRDSRGAPTLFEPFSKGDQHEQN